MTAFPSVRVAAVGATSVILDADGCQHVLGPEAVELAEVLE